MENQKVRVDFGDVLFVNAKMIADFAGVSRSKADQYMKDMRRVYKIDESRCLKGTLPATIVRDYFSFPIVKK